MLYLTGVKTFKYLTHEVYNHIRQTLNYTSTYMYSYCVIGLKQYVCILIMVSVVILL